MPSATVSYSRFTYGALQARLAGEAVAVSVVVRNAGDVPADEVVQVYVGPPGQAAVRAVELLRGFTRVTLRPGETRTVKVSVRSLEPHLRA